MKKIYLGLSIIIVILIGAGIYFTLKNNKAVTKDEEKIITLNTNYINNVNSEKGLNVDVYTNNENSLLNDYEYVDVSLVNTDSTYRAEIIKSSSLGLRFRNNKPYYSYRLEVKIEETELLPQLKDVKMKTPDFSIDLGNISFVNYENNAKDLDVDFISAVKNNKNYKTISGFAIKMYNKSNRDVTLNTIEMGNFNYINLKEAVVVDDPKKVTNIDDFIPNYNYLNKTTDKGEIIIPAKKSLSFVVPVYYKTAKTVIHQSEVYFNEEILLNRMEYIIDFDALDQYESVINEGTFFNS